jgi:hypothetical protein
MPISPGELERAAKRAGAEPPKVVSDRTCVGCGYQLRGLAIGGKCPECALPILAPGNIDDPLSQAPLHIIKRFRFGCWLAMGCVISQVALAVAHVRWPTAAQLWAAIMLGVAAVWFAAAALLTPAFHTPQAISWGFGERGKLRLVARWLQLSWVVGYAAHLMDVAGLARAGLGQAGGALETLFAIAVVAGLAGLVLLGVVLERLAAWARDDSAEKCFNAAIWGIPTATLLLWLDIPFPLLTWIVFLMWVVVVLAFPAGLFSLSRSVMFSVHHSLDWQERMRRKHERDEAYHERAGALAAKTTDPSAIPRRKTP